MCQNGNVKLQSVYMCATVINLYAVELEEGVVQEGKWFSTLRHSRTLNYQSQLLSKESQIVLGDLSEVLCTMNVTIRLCDV